MKMRRWICFLLCLIFCAVPASAAQAQSIDALMSDYMAANGLNEENFAISYFNSATGVSYSFNSDSFFPAGDAWYLPLHMYYYEQEALGVFEPEESYDDEFDDEFTIGGLTLEECRYQSIILGNEDVADRMRDALGNYRQFKLLINETYGRYPDDLLTDEYLTGNYYNADMLMNCLKYLDAHPELFGGLTANLRIAQTGDGFAAYDGKYALVHLRGEEDAMLCDLGAVAARQPYLLVCFVSEDAGGDEVLAQVNTLLCEYTDRQTDADDEATAPENQTTGEGSLPTGEPGESSAAYTPDDSTEIFIIVLVVGLVFIAVVGILVLRRWRGKK